MRTVKTTALRLFRTPDDRLVLSTEAEEHLRSFLEDLDPRGDLIIKPFHGSHGDGLVVLSNQDVEALLKSSINTSECERHLQPASFVVQPRVQQHPVLGQLHNSSLNTLRIVTFRDSRGRATVDGIVWRVGTNRRAVDSWRRGGVAIHVDCATAITGPAIQLHDGNPIFVRTHPDSKLVLQGIKLPYLKEVSTLACEAADNLAHARWVGWDIAIDRDGPLLIEGNAGWALPMMLFATNGAAPEEWQDRFEEAGVPDLGSSLHSLRSAPRFLVGKLVARVNRSRSSSPTNRRY